MVSLPQQPKAAHTTHETHSQTRSVDEHSSVGVQSFPVLATDGHRCRVADSTGRRILKRYWIVVAIALFTTVTVIGSTAIVVAKKKTASAVQVFRDADVATYQSNTSGYWLVSDGNLVVSREHVAGPIHDADRFIVLRYTHTPTRNRTRNRTHTHTHTQSVLN